MAWRMGEDVTMLHRGQVHADGVLARDRVQLTPGEIFPSMYVRNLQQEKGIEKIFGAVRTECTEWDWKGQVRTLVLWKRDRKSRMGLERAGANPCPMEE